LEGVLDHYHKGGRTIEAGAHAGHGGRNPYKSVFVRAFELSATERADLLSFLDALTDKTVLKKPSLSDP
jgi:cytochrome c peroxidase